MTGALAIVQCRMGSTRLPGKALAPLAGIPFLTHVLRRVKASQVSGVVLAIPDTPDNDVLAPIAEAEDVRVYRGSEDDVLSRFYWAAELHPDANPIVRITADDSFKDPLLINLALTVFLAEWGRDPAEAPMYLQLGGLTWPLGCVVEVFHRDALKEAYALATKPEDREHVTPFIAEHYPTRRMLLPNPNPVYGYDMNRRWTCDTAEDLAYAQQVYERLYADNPTFGYLDIVEAGL